MQMCGMQKHWKGRKPARLPAVSIESDQVGTPKEELNTALTQFRVSCGNPAQPESLSIRTVARISEDLTARYQPPYDPPCRLYPLSASAISEILSGKRQGLPAFDWVASYVLSCQRHAVGCRHGRRDQGTTILRPWASIYAAHLADTPSGATAAFCLPQHQQDFLSTHGPYGRTLLARAQRGHPHARYRAALLLACEPGLTNEALGLLIDVASAGHPLALDLLDDGREASQATGPADGPSPRTAAQRAWDLARTAWAYGADSQAYAFCRAAARGGIPDAILALARVRLADVDPEAAQWLGHLGTEATAGRHHASEQ